MVQPVLCQVEERDDGKDWRDQYFKAMKAAIYGTVCFVNKYYNGAACVDEFIGSANPRMGTGKRVVILMEPNETIPIGDGKEELPMTVYSALTMQYVRGYELNAEQILDKIVQAFKMVGHHPHMRTCAA